MKSRNWEAELLVERRIRGGGERRKGDFRGGIERPLLDFGHGVQRKSPEEKEKKPWKWKWLLLDSLENEIQSAIAYKYYKMENAGVVFGSVVFFHGNSILWKLTFGDLNRWFSGPPLVETRLRIQEEEALRMLFDVLDLDEWIAWAHYYVVQILHDNWLALDSIWHWFDQIRNQI